MKKIPVEGHKHLVRSADTGAILNINKTGIEEARAAKARKLEEKEEYEKLKSDVSEIKDLLKLLLVKING